MKIEEVRTSFTVYLIAGASERTGGLVESLGLAGYMVAEFNELTAAFSEFPSNPPHFLIFDAEEKKFNLAKAIKQVGAQLPESHIFLLTPLEKRAEAVPYLERGVYDLIYSPLLSPAELLRALDRAAERDYFMYMSERLAEAAPPPGAAGAEGEPGAGARADGGDGGGAAEFKFARRIFAKKNPDDGLQVFMHSLSGVFDGCGVVYFKYIANRRVLVAALGENIGGIELGGMGVDFNDGDTSFKSSQLREPMGIPSFTAMINEVFGTGEFFAEPVEVMGEVHGLLVFLRARPEGALAEILTARLLLLGKALALLEAERRLHVVNVKDPGTDLLNRQNFIPRLQQEVSRSRRTGLPTSLLLIAVDQYSQILSQLGAEEAQIVLRMAARVCEKHSRVNDVMGRTGTDEFGIVLPHTGRRGALIKAERLRRVLGSADFSKVLSAFPHITVSIGVSEYPSLVRDADELMQSADEALYQIRRSGDRTCVAEPPEGFTPDFQVHEKDAT